MKKEFILGLILPLLAGCASPSVAMESSSSPTKEEEAKEFAGFESEEECESVMSVSAWGTKFAFNQDPRYVSKGKGSLYVEFDVGSTIPMPNFYPDFYQNSRVNFDLLHDSYLLHENDYSKATAFLVDVYPTSKDVALYLNFTAKDNPNLYQAERQVAVKGRWNTLRFDLDPYLLHHDGISALNEISLQLDPVFLGGEDACFYLDDFKVLESSKEKDYSLALPGHEVGEVADFETSYLLHTGSWSSYGSPFGPLPQLKRIQKTSEEDMRVSRGRYALRVTRYPASPLRSSGAYFTYSLPEEYVATLPWVTLDPKETYLALDVYQEEDVPLDLVLRVVESSGNYLTSLNQDIPDATVHNATILPRQKTTIRIPLDANVCLPNGSELGKGMDFSSVKTISFDFREHMGAKRVEMYLDHLRFESKGGVQ